MYTWEVHDSNSYEIMIWCFGRLVQYIPYKGNSGGDTLKSFGVKAKQTMVTKPYFMSKMHSAEWWNAKCQRNDGK